jgi:hypothetical protein
MRSTLPRCSLCRREPGKDKLTESDVITETGTPVRRWLYGEYLDLVKAP